MRQLLHRHAARRIARTPDERHKILNSVHDDIEICADVPLFRVRHHVVRAGHQRFCRVDERKQPKVVDDALHGVRLVRHLPHVDWMPGHGLVCCRCLLVQPADKILRIRLFQRAVKRQEAAQSQHFEEIRPADAPQRHQQRHAADDARRRIDHLPENGADCQPCLHGFLVALPVVTAFAQILRRLIFQAYAEVHRCAAVGDKVVAVEDVIQRIGGWVANRFARHHRGGREAVTDEVARGDARFVHLQVRVHLHHCRALAVPADPEDEAAVRAAHVLQNVAQGEFFQSQLFRRFREGNFLLIRLELPREFQEAAVHPVLRCHTEIAEPVVEARTRAHEPNRDDVAPVQRGMEHHDRLAGGVIAAAQSQRAQHLSQRADGFQARAHPVFPPLGAQGIVRRQGSQFAIHLNGHVAPAGFDPRLNRHAIRGAGEFGAHAQRFLGQRRAQLAPRVMRPWKQQRCCLGQIDAG